MKLFLIGRDTEGNETIVNPMYIVRIKGNNTACEIKMTDGESYRIDHSIDDLKQALDEDYSRGSVAMNWLS
jgi:hypothetical protein